MRKCCENGQNLNLRAGVCVDDGARKWKNPPVYSAGGDGSQLVKSKAGNTILLDDVIRNVEEPKKPSLKKICRLTETFIYCSFEVLIVVVHYD